MEEAQAGMHQVDSTRINVQDASVVYNMILQDYVPGDAFQFVFFVQHLLLPYSDLSFAHLPFT